MRLSSKNSERNCERPSLVWFQCRRRRGVRAWRRRQRHPISVSWHCLTPERLLTNFCLTTHPKAFSLRRDAFVNFYHHGSHILLVNIEVVFDIYVLYESDFTNKQKILDYSFVEFKNRKIANRNVLNCDNLELDW